MRAHVILSARAIRMCAIAYQLVHVTLSADVIHINVVVRVYVIAILIVLVTLMCATVFQLVLAIPSVVVILTYADV